MMKTGSATAPAGQILPTYSAELFEAALQRAAELLRAGQLVGLPTETVYGLGANALDPVAVRAIYTAKGRPAYNPIIVHVADIPMARNCASAWPATAETLACAFWPGPLTLVLPRSAVIPDIVTAGGGTVGIRCPDHPFMRGLIGRCGFPIAAPSANRSNELSPTTALHVLKSFGSAIPLIVDGGASQVGIESTVIDLTADPPQVLRPGMITAEAIAAVLVGNVAVNAGSPRANESATPRSPGLLARHYQPKAPLRIWFWRDADDLVRRIQHAGFDTKRAHVIAHSCIPISPELPNVSVVPPEAEAFARAIYSELHRCDENEAGLIIVESIPEGARWEGIADRLQRASTGVAGNEQK